MISIPVIMTKQEPKRNSALEQQQHLSDKIHLICDNSISKDLAINKMKPSSDLIELHSGPPLKRIKMNLVKDNTSIIKKEINITGDFQPKRTLVLSNNATLPSSTQQIIQTSIGPSYISDNINLTKETSLLSNNSDIITDKLTRSSTSLLTSTHSNQVTINHQDLSKYTTMRISDLAAKDFNPLFEENSNMSDVTEEPKYSGAISSFSDNNGGNSVDKQSGVEEMSEGRVEFENDGYIVGDMVDCFDAETDSCQQLDSVKQIQVR